MPQTPSAQLDSIFSALSNSTRRAILRQLAHGEATVGQLGLPFQLAASTMTKHLDVLEEAGLVERVRDGRHRRARLSPSPLWDGMDWIQGMRRLWTEQLDALEELLERERGAS